MRRKIKPPINYWALPAPVQDAIIEQVVLICHSSSMARVLRMRLVCKHFDRHIKRLVYGGDLLKVWPLLKKDDPNPLRLSLIEGAKSYRHGRLNLIQCLQDTTDKVIVELGKMDLDRPHALIDYQQTGAIQCPEMEKESERQAVAEVVFATAAAAGSHMNRMLIPCFLGAKRQTRGLCPVLAAAFGLHDQIKQASAEDVSAEDDVFGYPVDAAAYHGYSAIVCTLLMKANTRGAYCSKALRWAVCRGHVGIAVRLMETLEIGDHNHFRILEDILEKAVRSRQPRAFQVVFEVCCAHSFQNSYYCTRYLQSAIICEVYDIIPYLLDVYDRQSGSENFRGGVDDNVNGVIRLAVEHHHDGPLQLILERGHGSDFLARASESVYVQARRTRTLRLLHTHGVDLSYNMDVLLQRAVRHNWDAQIKFLGSIRKASDTKAFQDALARAIVKKRKDCIDALLDIGINSVAIPCLPGEPCEGSVPKDIVALRDSLQGAE